MPMYDNLLLLHEDAIIGQAADEYTAAEQNFGVTTPAPNLSGNFGMHIVVTTTFTGSASGVIMWIVHGAATTPTTKHTGMFIPVASLVAGAHFFVPCGSIPLLQYARGLYDEEEVSTAGKMTIWFGPGPHGAGS
jgi:hypothetical protein